MTLSPQEEQMWAEYEDAVAKGEVKVIGEPVFRNGDTALTEDELREIFGVGRPSLGASHARGEGRSPVIQFSLTREDKERLEHYAASHGMKTSQAARHAVQLMLANA